MTEYVTDDPYTTEVIIRYSMKRKFMNTEIINGKSEYNFHKDPTEIIECGIREGFFKVHLELGEWYYHPTASGIALLKCDCCGDERFEDDECSDPPLVSTEKKEWKQIINYLL